ncbi:putative membrane-associated [Pseudomonas chlororaphis]|uniref:Putative membrane-associated n=1 Tax=Pseudomonas chlororaphis TaxID=587753 RepID=A0A3G7TKE6_9PSED|nr:hypothetical protein [Pseudomonas chlororaphis]AZE47331.1 putative membrane-associated [Pseudomonas chlororaphis]
MTEPNLVTGSYIVKSEHTLTQSPLEMAIAGMEGAATRFSIDAIKDERVRASYQRNIKRMSEQIFADVRAGNISVEEGTKFSNEMRNKIMFEHRRFTSAHGLAIVQKKKKSGKTYTEILNEKSKTQFGQNYEQLSKTQQKEVLYKALERSGSANAKFTSGTKIMSVMGKVGIILTAALATYEILEADNKVKESARQATILGAGAAGGFLAGLGVSAICGPAAPACAIAVILIGSAAGGVAGGVIADTFDDELEELSHWDIF